MTWMFWLLVVFLFAESWGRAWAVYHRGDERRRARRASHTG